MVVPSPGRLFVCGTNSFRPMCNTYVINDSNYTLEATKNGQAVCPYDPRHNSTSVLAGKLTIILCFLYTLRIPCKIPSKCKELSLTTIYNKRRTKTYYTIRICRVLARRFELRFSFSTMGTICAFCCIPLIFVLFIYYFIARFVVRLFHCEWAWHICQPQREIKSITKM